MTHEREVQESECRASDNRRNKNCRSAPGRPPACLLPLLVAVLLALTSTAGCAAPAKAILDEEWQAVSISGARVGYVHSVTRLVEDPEPVVVTAIFSETHIRRFGIALSLRSDIEYRETPSGRILSVTSRNFTSNLETVSRAEVRGDRIAISTQTAGSTHTNEIPLDPELVGPHAQQRLLRETRLAPGVSVSFKSFLPEFQRIIHSTLTIEKSETLEIRGEELELWRGTMVQDILPGVRTTVWIDKDGGMVRSLTHVLGNVETVRTTREEALKGIIPSEMADVMTRFFIPSNVTLENPSRVTNALFRIEGDLAALQALALEDRRQTIEKQTPEALWLRVRALGDAPKAAAARPGGQFLASSPYVQCKDPELVELARKAVGNAASPRERALRLRAWVFENVNKKDYRIGFASAKEVAVSRQGDCTEHAVLLAALLRAVDIPSRVAVGLVYWKGMFGYHMWTEAFLNDWTALDATLDQEIVDATHIKFCDSPLDTASAAGPFLSLVPVIGKIKLSVEETAE